MEIQSASKDSKPQTAKPIVPFFAPTIQKKLSVGSANDSYEVEADHVADRVMRMSVPQSQNATQTGPLIQRKCSACEQEEKVQMKPLADSITPLIQRSSHSESGGHAPSHIESQINGSKGGGSYMDHSTQHFMESRFGTNFSDVKIHTGGQAVQMSRELNAQAFTVGNDIYFNEGKYSPQSESGKHLLAHELTHTVQQGGGVQTKIQKLGTPFGPAVSGPSNWGTQVSGATTSAQKTALIQTVVGSSVTVNDATAASSTDGIPDPTHLSPFTLSSPVINFDQNLVTKRARGTGGRSLNINAGYTFQHGSANYVVIADAALDGTNYNQTLQTINHEFDHINQFLRNSPLVGNESELDAWVSTFIREFHHSYSFRPQTSGPNCYVELALAFAPLSMYYQQVSNATQRSSAVSRIHTYYTTTISQNVANTHAFRFWVLRSMKSTSNPDLGTHVNTALSLGINSTDSLGTFRSIPCASVPTSILPGSSVLVMPTAPAVSGSKSAAPKP